MGENPTSNIEHSTSNEGMGWGVGSNHEFPNLSADDFRSLQEKINIIEKEDVIFLLQKLEKLSDKDFLLHPYYIYSLDRGCTERIDQYP